MSEKPTKPSSSETTSSPTEQLTKAAEMLQMVAKPLVAFITFVLPFVIRGTAFAWRIYKSLPKNAIKFWTGFIFCFFGGLYPVVFAAVQAAEHGGRKTVVAAMQDLSEEAVKIIEESKKDDEKDEDGDGTPDVQQISNKEFMMRKVNLVATKMDPVKFDKALASIYRVWLSVIAVLTVQFARTISLALTISDFVKNPVDRYICPLVCKATPEGYRRWVPVVSGWIIKAIAMSLAWYIQSIISAFTSALTGGLMMSRALYDFCVYRNVMPNMMPKDHNESHVDELLSYAFAALGFYFQFKIGFDMPFPFNLILWPLEFAEYYLRWTITKVT